MNETAQTQDTAAASKAKAKQSSNLIAEAAQEIETLTKTKALNLAEKLVTDIDNNSFRLGGVLKVIYDNSWFDGFETFDAYVAEKFGFQSRKAKYLMEIYTHLVEKQIPWEKVEGLGWTKLKDLARFLTQENVDEWVAKATPVTVVELQKMLKDSAGVGDVNTTVEASSDSVTVKFKLKADQQETVQQALAKAKAEAGTEYDTVALEMICTGYLGGSVQTAAPTDLNTVLKAAGWEAVLEAFDKLFPEVSITVET